MAISYVRYNGTGAQTNFSITFPYLDEDHVEVRVNGSTVAFTWVNSTTVAISPAPENGAIVELRRNTPSQEPFAEWQDGAIVTEEQLAENTRQALFVSQESEDSADDALSLNSTGRWDADNIRIENIANPVSGQDAVTKSYLDSQVGADYNAQAQAAAIAAEAAQEATELILDEVSGAVFSVDTVADLKALTSRPLSVFIKGYWSADGGGGGLVYWDDGSTTPSDDGLVFECSAGPVGRYKRSFSGRVHTSWFGAGLGQTNDKAALDSWGAALVAGHTGFVDPAVHTITAPLAAISSHNIDIDGVREKSLIRYTGVGTTPGNLITFGDGITAYQNLTIKNFGVGSSTTLEANSGADFAIRVRKSLVIHIDVIVNDGGKIYNGLWLDNSSYIYLQNSRLYVINDKVTWNDGIELRCQSAWLGGIQVGGQGTGIGVHVAGGCGGFHTDAIDALFNDITVKIDNSISAAGNTQMFIDRQSLLDSGSTAAVYVDDSTSNPISKVLFVDGWLSSNTAAAAPGLHIKNWTGGFLHFNGQSKNHQGSAIKIEDATLSGNVIIGDGSDISYNFGYGFEAPAGFVVWTAATIKNNSLGNFSPGVIRRTASTYEVDIQVAGSLASDGPLPDFSGLLVIANTTNGDIGSYVVGGGGAALLGTSTGSWAAPTTTPASNKASVAIDGSHYRIYNNFSSTIMFNVRAIVAKDGI